MENPPYLQCNVVEIQSKDPLSAVKKWCRAPRVWVTLFHSNTRSRGEQSIGMQEVDNKKRGGRGQGMAANVWGDHDT